ncbi:MAG TPA: LamG domain-containing protein [Streptosporangiaceae bacterium]|nr:LamG domain-containing protein [Streptosporangiaceae bacterium]
MLTAHWTFDAETIDGRQVADSTGSGLTAIMDETVEVVPGRVAGQALAFDGKSRATIPAGPQLVLSQLLGFSIAFHLQVTEAPTGEWRGILYKQVTEHDARGFGVWLYPDMLRLRVQLFTAKGPEYADNRRILRAGEWTHVAVIVDLDEMYVYIDGELDVAVPLPSPVVTPAGPIFLGRDPTGLGFTGLLGDLRVYATALTGEAVQAIMD